MSALTDQQRLFVQSMIRQGVNPKAAQTAAVEAGYNKLYGYELMRHDGVLAAIREESVKRVSGAVLAGVNVMLKIAHDDTHKDQYKAAKDLAALNGFTAEQRIVVEHISEDTKGQMRQIREMAIQLNLDPKQLIAAAGIVEGDFVEVEEVPAEADYCGIVEVDDSEW